MKLDKILNTLFKVERVEASHSPPCHIEYRTRLQGVFEVAKGDTFLATSNASVMCFRRGKVGTLHLATLNVSSPEPSMPRRTLRKLQREGHDPSMLKSFLEVVKFINFKLDSGCHLEPIQILKEKLR